MILLGLVQTSRTNRITPSGSVRQKSYDAPSQLSFCDETFAIIGNRCNLDEGGLISPLQRKSISILRKTPSADGSFPAVTQTTQTPYDPNELIANSNAAGLVDPIQFSNSGGGDGILLKAIVQVPNVSGLVGKAVILQVYNNLSDLILGDHHPLRTRDAVNWLGSLEGVLSNTFGPAMTTDPADLLVAICTPAPGTVVPYTSADTILWMVVQAGETIGTAGVNPLNGQTVAVLALYVEES